MTEIAIQPMRNYSPDKLKDPNKQFLYVVPRILKRVTLSKREDMCPLTSRIAKLAAEIDESLSAGVAIDTLQDDGDGPVCILAIRQAGATRSTRTWDHEVHFTRQVLHAARMDDMSIYRTPPFIAPILAPANPWFGNWGEGEGCRSQAVMMAQAEFYHQLDWDTIILDHEARWSVNGWGLQLVTEHDIARLRTEDEL